MIGDFDERHLKVPIIKVTKTTLTQYLASLGLGLDHFLAELHQLTVRARRWGIWGWEKLFCLNSGGICQLIDSLVDKVFANVDTCYRSWMATKRQVRNSNLGTSTPPPPGARVRELGPSTQFGTDDEQQGKVSIYAPVGFYLPFRFSLPTDRMPADDGGATSRNKRARTGTLSARPKTSRTSQPRANIAGGPTSTRWASYVDPPSPAIFFSSTGTGEEKMLTL